MALFNYQALSSSGKKLKGTISAETLYEAKEKLFKEELFLTKISPAVLQKKRTTLTKKELYFFTKELAKLYKASLPLYDALLTLEEKYQGSKNHTLILDLLDQIKKGRSFSQALSLHKDSFDLLYVSMIQSAEESANLQSALEELSELLKKQLQLKKELITSLSYPALLLLFSFSILLLLLYSVIPSLAELFEGRNLHPFTQTVVFLSNKAIQYKWILLVTFSIGLSLFITSFFSKGIKNELFKCFLKAPLVGPLLSQAALMRFSRTISTLLQSGISLVDSLHLAKRTVMHPFLEEEITNAAQGVMQGAKLSNELAKGKYFPKLFIRMTAVAEESGNLANAMENLAEIYEEESEKIRRNINTYLQPIMLLIMGVIIAFIMLSVLLPLTDVSSFMMN